MLFKKYTTYQTQSKLNFQNQTWIKCKSNSNRTQIEGEANNNMQLICIQFPLDSCSNPVPFSLKTFYNAWDKNEAVL